MVDVLIPDGTPVSMDDAKSITEGARLGVRTGLSDDLASNRDVHIAHSPSNTNGWHVHGGRTICGHCEALSKDPKSSEEG